MTRRLAGPVALACSLLLQACGGVTVLPTGPTVDTEKIEQGDPTILRFKGTIQDGGYFNGYILFGGRDIDSRPEFGRYRALHWEVNVIGGSVTKDYHFNDTLGGRALIETYKEPFPIVSLIFLWPAQDPTVQGLTPHFHGAPAYNPDVPPTLEDFRELLPGEAKEAPREAGAVVRGTLYTFGTFRDGQGGESLVSSVQFDAPITVPGVRPESK